MERELVDGLISVVVPAYNEPALPNVVEAIRAEMARLGRPYEVLVVDDASTVDCTSQVPASNDVRIIRQPVNLGYGASLKEGIRQARGSIVVMMDGDGQHRPADIEHLLAPLDQGADGTLGARRKTIHSSWWRMPGKWLLVGLARYLSRRRIPDINCGFRGFRIEAARRYLPLCCDRFSFSTTLALSILLEGRKVVFVPLDVEPRQGRSTVRPGDGFTALLAVVQIIMLFAPLRVLMPPALVLLTGGSALLIRDIIKVNIHQDTMLLLIGGMLVFFFGLLADQIAAIRRRLL